jgi:hypothetical protein
MSRTTLGLISQRIELERAIKHIGTASVSLNALSFPHSQALNQANVERLKRSFCIERGLRQDDLHNRIPAVIDEGLLGEVLTGNGLSIDSLQSGLSGQHVQLEFPNTFRLECLQGRHRVEAAYQAFPYSDKRWIIDLYPAGMLSAIRQGERRLLKPEQQTSAMS